jgi:2-ketoarginine methyltransferase
VGNVYENFGVFAFTVSEVSMFEHTGVESRLIEGLQPIRGYVVAAAIHQFFELGIFDELDGSGPRTANALGAKLGLEPDRLGALMQFLRNEGFLDEQQGAAFVVTEKARALSTFRGWYTMLIGGYGSTFLQLGDALRRGGPFATRNAGLVGIGSCAISQYDAIPLTRSLIRRAASPIRRLLDLGCGNARYLVDLCKAEREIDAWGVEPDLEGYRAAVELVRTEGLAGRIRLSCSGASEFMKGSIDFEPDCLVLGFVLHEVLGQEGEDGVIRFLRQVVDRFPAIHLVVIEVDQRMSDPAVMRHGLALAYYNAYYLLHAITPQRLESQSYWEHLFERCDLDVLAKQSVDADVDSTGLEVGYLLRRARRAMPESEEYRNGGRLQ